MAVSDAARASLPRRVVARLSELASRKELLANLVVRDLKVRYRNSILGFAWSMVSPLAMMLVFTVIFTQVFPTGLEDFTVFFLAAFLPWLYFSNAVQGSVGAIVGNANLIKKVYFPREILPLSTTLAQGIHFLLSLAVFAVFILVKGYNFLPFLPLLIVVAAIQTVLNAGLSMLFAAGNVVFRDLQELTNVIFLLWFYGTPIIYQFEMAPPGYQWVLRLNPMTWFVGAYRDMLYYLQVPSAKLLLACCAFAAVSFVAGYALFSRLAVTFAKEV